MFCFRIKRKLYDYLKGNLSKAGAEKIKTHLQRCPDCAKEYKEMKQVLSLISQKKLPEPASQFWANFEQELDKRLAKEKVLPQEIRLRPLYLPQISLKPVLAVACAFILLITLSFYIFGGLPTKARLIALAEEQLINDIEVIEELTDEFVILDDKDTLLDELDFLEQLS